MPMRSLCLLALFLVALPSHAQAPKTAPVSNDGGRLDPTWFGPEVALAPGLELDFVWIRPGTSLKGKRLQLLPWEFGVLLNRQREVRDQLAAGFFTYRMPRMLDQFLRSQWGNEVEVGTEPGDYRLVGRIVDASIQAKGSAFMLGPFIGLAQTQQVTWDLKILDSENTVVAAIHHRWATTGNVDPFRMLSVARVYQSIQPFAGALAPLTPKVEAWPKTFDLKGPVPSKYHHAEAVLEYGTAGPLLLKGKTLRVAPWRVSEEGLGPGAWEYGVCAEQTFAQLTQAFAAVVPPAGTAADYVLDGVIRAQKDRILYQARMVDGDGNELFRMEQTLPLTHHEHLEGRDGEFVEAMLPILCEGEGGFQIPIGPKAYPASLMPSAGRVWMAPNLNLSNAHIEILPWPVPVGVGNVKPNVMIFALASARALPGLLGGAFVQASKGNTNGVGTVVSEGATHRLEGQLVDIGKDELATMECRLVEIESGKTVWAMRLLIEESSAGHDQTWKGMEQIQGKKVQALFPSTLYNPLPAAP
jgi:hypothetical protein